jgi:methylmalonyl-CoA mutase N-terminal domain/subunit
LESEAAANDYIRRIDEMGGMISAIEAGYPQTEIASASYRYQREIEIRRARHCGRQPLSERRSADRTTTDRRNQQPAPDG